MNKVLLLVFVVFLLQGFSSASIDPKPEPVKTLVEALMEEGEIVQYNVCKLSINEHKVFICFFIVHKETGYVLAVDVNEKKELDIQYILKASSDRYDLVWKKYGIEEPRKEPALPKATRSI